jgi:exopolysaccharide biosynthesis polyprenyl glycosylphosphotransferase
MTIRNKQEAALLFLGDVTFFLLSLWAMLALRYLALPTWELFRTHLVPFSILFCVWVVVFFIAGLYGKHTLILKSRLPGIIFHALTANSIIAISFFYFIPYFGITPKINLFLYLGISAIFILAWRIYGHTLLGFRKKQKALLIGSGEEMGELKKEVNHNPRYSLTFVSSIDLDDVEELDFQREIVERIYTEGISIIVVNLRNEKVGPILPSLYNLIFSRIRFIDMHKAYEDIFDRVPLSLMKYSWFLENISLSSRKTYDILKRLMDISAAFVLGIMSLAFYPIVFMLIKLDDGGPIFTFQERVGQYNRPIRLVKFRTMERNDGGKWGDGLPNKVTRVGKFLRKSRIDELPQLWNVLVGDLSLIGPRPEFPDPAKSYDKEIPYYNVRYLIKPGLSGWAQICHVRHPHHQIDVRETKVKVSYDLYYIKNRSFLLDLKIAAKTIKTLLSRSGV